MVELPNDRTPNRALQVLLFRGNSTTFVSPFWTMVNPSIQRTCSRLLRALAIQWVSGDVVITDGFQLAASEIRAGQS
jgi:hypothetical protein